MNLLITGGAGFIGANLVLHWLRNHPDDVVINFDALTYAGNLENLQEAKTHPNYRFVLGDLRKPHEISKAFSVHNVDAVIHLAAESHVDRSILGPVDFIQTNAFVERFRENGTFSDWLRDIPISICTNTHLPLFGAYFVITNVFSFTRRIPFYGV